MNLRWQALNFLSSSSLNVVLLSYNPEGSFMNLINSVI